MTKKDWLLILVTIFTISKPVSYDLAAGLVLAPGITYHALKQELQQAFDLENDRLELEYLVIELPQQRTKFYISSAQLDQKTPISEKILLALAQGGAARLECKSSTRS